MKKKLKKELNKLLRKQELELAFDSYTFNNKSMIIKFDVKACKKSMTKEELLAKAKEMYKDGFVIHPIVKFSNGLKFSKEYECTVNGGHYWDRGNNSPSCKTIGSRPYACLYDEKAGWAPIIKKPIIKIEKKWLYEGDEYWYVDKLDNFKLENATLACNILNDEYVKNSSGDVIRFLTKQSALDYVMVEAKKRFEGCAKIDYNSYTVNFNSLNLKFSPPYNNAIEDDKWVIWRHDEGFIAKPIKETLMLGKYEIEFDDIKVPVDTTNTSPGYPYTFKPGIKCKDVSVTKEEWFKWYRNYKSLLNYTGEIMFKLGNYHIYANANDFYVSSTDVNISDITIDQIEKITDKLNGL